MAPKPQGQRRGIALGVMGVMLLIFFAMVSLFGKQHQFEIPHASAGLHAHHPLDAQPGLSGRPSLVIKETKDASTQTDPSIGLTHLGLPGGSGTGTPAAISTGAGGTGTTSQVPTPTTAQPVGGQGDGLTQLDKDYAPTREMVQRIAQDGYLVVTWANWHYQDFVRTWVMHVKAAGITGYIVGAMDDHLLKLLVDTKVHAFSMRSGLTLGDFGWGSKTFAKMGREKIKLIRVFLNLGVSVVISDVDVLWLRNPISYFQQYPDADVLSSSDHLVNTVPGYELEDHTKAGSAANIGIMMFRAGSMAFVNEWIDIIEKDDVVWDQNAFNDLYRKRGVQAIPGNTQNLFKGYGGNLTMGILPVAAFCSGHTYFTQRLWKQLGLEPYAVHATFQFSGTPGKRHRMREFMLFDDPPEYYDHPTGFVSFKMDGVESLLKYAGPNDDSFKLTNVQGHFKLMTHQIQRVRTGMAISTLLGRPLIMPELWCGLDRWWAPHTGRIPGSATPLPFQCPMDHVFDLENGLHARKAPAEFGPHIHFKEYSFLSNPRMSDAVRRSKVTVELCEPGDASCSDGSAPAPVEDGKVRVQKGLLSERLRTALHATNGYKVLEFTTMDAALQNFTDSADWTRFFNRVKEIGSIWCCVQAHPGHVHYDPWWDIPHTDKFGRWWDTWEPKCGP